MKSKNLTLIAAVSSFLLAASFQANAATSITASSNIINLTGGVGTATFKNVNGASWVSESMGYLGWTHFSKWGFVTLKKGKAATIIVDATAVKGFHPGITVWQRKANVALPTALPVAPTAGETPTPVQALFYMNDHSYDQASSISVPNATDETNNVKVGNISMTYVASGFDVDNLGDKFTIDAGGMLRPYSAETDATASVYGPYLPMGYATVGLANSQKLSDKADTTTTPPVSAKTPGRVALTFTPTVTGVYQFVVGGLKPDVGSPASKNANKGGTDPATGGNIHSVEVTVIQK
jgi:hypothetical protein